MTEAAVESVTTIPGTAFLQDPIITGMSGGRSVRGATWSPDGSQLAFVWARDGVPTVWTMPAETNGGSSRQVSSTPIWLEMTDLVDRRDVAGGPQWSPDGRSFAYAGRTASHTTSIFTLSRETGESVQLTDHPRSEVAMDTVPSMGCDRTPRWSPDGTRIAFVCSRDGWDQLWVVPSDGTSGPVQVTYDRFDNNDLQWSPDGAWLAFASQRNADDIFASAICVVSSTGGMVRQLTDGVDGNDRSPRWSPDGASIAFISDRSGYDEIWLVSHSDGQLRQLTHAATGDGADPNWSPDGRLLLFTRTRGVNQDLWSVPASGGPETRLSAADGVYSAPEWSPAGDRITYLYSGPTAPPDLWMLQVETGTTSRLTSSTSDDLSAIDPIVPEIVTYTSSDGTLVEALLYRAPRSFGSADAPAVVWIHGGPNAHITNIWYPYFQHLAQQGYVVLAPNSRGSTGYGRAFRERDLDFWGGRDTLDWRGAVEYLAGLPGVDGSRVAIWGSSYGGFAALISLSKMPDLFKVGICHYGPCDLAESYDDTRIRAVRRLLRRQMESLPIENPALWYDRSAINFADNVTAPLLILQGDVDGGVHPRQSTNMYEALRARGATCELTIYSGEGHGFSKPDTVADVARQVEGFLDRYL